MTDDPYTYGRIAATNALSDIYAKGGKPICAMNFLGYPFALAPLDWAKDILRGGKAVLNEIGVPLLGGHTVDNSEPLYGLSVIGEVSKGGFIRNSSLEVGDLLISTKPLGIGVIVTGMKNTPDIIDSNNAKTCISAMTTSNKMASEIMKSIGVDACTDITGFGLLGHLAEMISPNKLIAELYFEKIPILDGAASLIEKGVISQGMHRNQDYLQLLKSVVDFKTRQSLLDSILYDPQTSGGLLIGVKQEKASLLLRELEQFGAYSPAIIGRVIGAGDEAKITVV